jgi:hypothetical protein
MRQTTIRSHVGHLPASWWTRVVLWILRTIRPWSTIVSMRPSSATDEVGITSTRDSTTRDGSDAQRYNGPIATIVAQFGSKMSHRVARWIDPEPSSCTTESTTRSATSATRSNEPRLVRSDMSTRRRKSQHNECTAKRYGRCSTYGSSNTAWSNTRAGIGHNRPGRSTPPAPPGPTTHLTTTTSAGSTFRLISTFSEQQPPIPHFSSAS